MKKFKRLVDPNKEETPMQSILGQEYEAHFVEPPMEMEPDESFELSNSMSITSKSQSLDTYNRDPSERENVLQGYHQQRGGPAARFLPRKMDSGSVRSSGFRADSTDDFQGTWSRSGSPSIPSLSRTDSVATKRSIEGTRGHARDPLEEEFPYLFIGPSTYTGSSHNDTDDSQPATIFEEPEITNLKDTPMTEVDDVPIVSESPGAAEFDIYENAYREEVERICKHSIPRRGTAPKMYLTRRVDGKDEVMRLVQDPEGGFEPNQRNQQPLSQTVPIGGKVAVTPSSSFTSAVGMIRTQLEEQRQQQQPQPESQPEPQPQDQAMPEPPTSETNDKKTPSSPPENPRAKLRCLLGRVRGS